MSDKNFSTAKFDGALNVIDGIAKKYSIDSVLGDVDGCRKDIPKFSIKLLFVGQTNAGKSALINAILERPSLLLKEDQAPETAIAAELIFDEKEFIRLVDDEGKELDLPLEPAPDFDPDKYDHCEYHIKNDFVSKIRPYIMVDMPGTESGIERHNKAIMRYICQGNAFVLVIDSDQGTIRGSVSNFINEIKQYDDNLGIVITKSDLKISDIESIKENIEQQAEILFEKNVVVAHTSKFVNSHENAKKLETIINSFDKQSLFEQKFSPVILKSAYMCQTILKNLKDAMRLDETDIVKEISIRENKIAEFQQHFSDTVGKFKKNFNNRVKNQIVAKAENSLYENINSLVASAKSNNSESFSDTINNILRPVFITSTQNYIDDSFESFIQDLNVEESFGFEEILNNVSDIFKRGGEFLISKKSEDDESGGGKSTNLVYKTVIGALSIVTTTVTPWLEIIIFFLPDIFKLFKGLSAKNVEEKIREKIQTEIIPQIISKIEPNVAESLTEIETEFTQKIKSSIDELIEIETNELKKMSDQRASNKDDFDRKYSDINNDYDSINNVISILTKKE